MKYAFYFFLIASLNGFSQKVDILLIGVSHNYGKSPTQDVTGIYSKIRQFKPQAFFGEFVSKEDERLLADYWCKQDNLKRLDRLVANRDIDTARLPNTIDSLKRLSVQHPADFRLKIGLAHAYYLNQDVANGHFQFWKVFNHLRKTPNQEIENYLAKVLAPQLDVSGRSMTRLKTSEYDLIAFPMMAELGMAELFPMDCQDYDLNWSAAAAAFHAKFEAFKKDASGGTSNVLKAMLDRRDKGFERYAQAEKNATNFTEWLNTPEASAILASGDFYFEEMYDIKGFPKQEMLSQLHWWLKRNEGMCANVVERARAQRVKRIVVIVGANHRAFMTDAFIRIKGVSVSGIDSAD
ncbi:DUF5694 domain-containing protein [Flavobacterium selenitireducens]|uniref:DUF5694 domain-containing protein n=1 Tax=Flavobacterium selenitireducens TaxID=2722704 RepID=UPI00168B6C73|nr:DUF5694 domain-containing protein [Flavobacterium selenitireducens]MBD3583521.1 hypothetical protein [Flavobacterium selenitireducens]